MRAILLTLLFTPLLFAELLNGVAVLVMDTPITLHEIKTYAAKEGMGIEQSTEALIRKRLEEIEVAKRGLSISSQEVFDEIESLAEQNGMNVMQFYTAMQNARGISQSELKESIRERQLNQKLYNAIAFSEIDQPSAEEEAEYYTLHRAEFNRPEAFEVVVYRSEQRERLEEKRANPMFYSPQVQSQNVTLPSAQINPQLAAVLAQTEPGSFTSVVPAPEGGFMMFYLQSQVNPATIPLEQVRPQIANAIVGARRNQVLNDYFNRMRLNADIRVLRMPQ